MAKRTPAQQAADTARRIKATALARAAYAKKREAAKLPEDPAEPDYVATNHEPGNIFDPY